MDAKAPPQDVEASEAQALIEFASRLGEQQAKLLVLMGANPHVVALAGLRMVIDAMAYLTREDRELAEALARYVGREMLNAVDQLGLRDKENINDGA